MFPSSLIVERGKGVIVNILGKVDRKQMIIYCPLHGNLLSATGLPEGRAPLEDHQVSSACGDVAVR